MTSVDFFSTCIVFYTGDDEVESFSSLAEVESDDLFDDEILYDEFEIPGRFHNR